jgi:2-haloacid dehalogenase
MAGETVITFDFYGTLVQWHETVEASCADILARHGRPPTEAAPLVAAMMHAFHTEGRRLRDTPPWRPYRQVLRDSIAFAMGKVGLQASAEDTDGMIGRLSRIPAHPEVPAALAQLKKRYRLAAISNTDDDIIAGSVPSLGVALDAVVTAQQAQAYKPDPRLFQHAHKVLGVTPREVVHVAMSQGLDMAVCKVLGIRAFWVNRGREQAEEQYRPYTEVKNLTEVLPLL